MNIQQDVPYSAVLATGRVIVQFFWVTSLSADKTQTACSPHDAPQFLLTNCIQFQYDYTPLNNKWVTIMSVDKNKYLMSVKGQIMLNHCFKKKITTGSPDIMTIINIDIISLTLSLSITPLPLFKDLITILLSTIETCFDLLLFFLFKINFYKWTSGIKILILKK